MTHCQHLNSDAIDRSPFNRMLITGYYDGPTDGITECRECGQTYAFRKLDWDEGQDVRIFGLAPLEGPLEQIRDALKLGQGNAEQWIVPPLGDEARNALQLIEHSPVCVIVASLDLQKSLIAVRAVASDDIGERDWFAWLGLNR